MYKQGLRLFACCGVMIVLICGDIWPREPVELARKYSLAQWWTVTTGSCTEQVEVNVIQKIKRTWQNVCDMQRP